MALLLQLISVRKVLEIGTYTGHSTLWLASDLSEYGSLMTCDVDEEATEVARR